MPRQTPPGIHPQVLDQFSCRMCEHWPDNEAMIAKEGNQAPAYRCKTGGRAVQHSDRPCREFQLGIVRCFHCDRTNHRVTPAICAYRHFNDSQPKCARCPLGETVAEHMMDRGYAIRERKDVLEEIGRRGRDRDREGRAG